MSLIAGPHDPSEDNHAPGSVLVVEVHGPLLPAEVTQLCEFVSERLPTVDAPGITCDVHGAANLGVVDALARLALMATEHHGWLRLRYVDADLAELLVLTGLADVLGLRLEPGRESESGEQGGVEEVVDVADPAG